MTCTLLSARALVEQARSGSVASAAGPAGADAISDSLAPVAAAPPAAAEAQLREFRVVGTVRDESGDPVGGARVESRSAAAGSLSDGDGAYEIVLVPRDEQAPLLHFSANGYENEKVALPSAALEGFEGVHVDVQLARVGTRAVVSGVLRDTRGRPIAGQIAQLQSTTLAATYAARTDAQGAFAIRGVKVGGAYDLIVRPEGAYADYWRRGIAVPERGAVLEVVLEPLALQRVEGRMIDAEGRPVPHFSLSIRSEGSRARMVVVQGDAEGRFAADGVPAGALHLAATSPPRHVIRGVRADERGREIEVVVDAGDRQLEGHVLDARGNPVAGAQLDLAWLHRRAEQQSSSVRRSVSDPSGAFHFGGLGPGPHRLTVSAAEQHAPLAAIEVPSSAGNVEVRLDRAQP